MEQEIGQRICSHRKGKGLTQEQLGAQLNVTGQAVSRWEKGESLPDVLLLPDLCKRLDMALEEFFGVSAEHESSKNAEIKTYLQKNAEEIAYYLRILSDEVCLAVLGCISKEKAVTKKDIVEQLHITDEAVVNRILFGFMKRGIIVCKADMDGERGYMYGKAMAEVYTILAACKAMGKHVK